MAMFETSYPHGPRLDFEEHPKSRRPYRLFPRYFHRGWSSHQQSIARVLDQVWRDMYEISQLSFPPYTRGKLFGFIPWKFKTWRFVNRPSGEDNYFEFTTKGQAMLVKLQLDRR